ncbi:6-carboxytetrahydropterin synthase [Psychromonas sp. SR45-3]|uniref:6-carboxytetrahydropterin synthase n=1 Tax=Psychromonas sp. SR45-3 TaxID=2760930 RepID=UPI0015FCF1B2|nr:6-carboxytetrahydropterin synthase [Psychromonas sp. SR45-3]MBB1272996.1 6-carboxytetrahydropterin synthase [Psychromonas sp. SR45-3]
MKLFVRDLTVIDSTYLDHKRGFVGESYQVDVVLDGQLNEQSMLLDFSLVKKQIKAIIDAEVDHKLIVPKAAKQCTISIDADRTQVDYVLEDNSAIQLKSPHQAYCLLECDAVTISVLEAYLEQVLLVKLPENITGLSITLRSEVISTPFYHYTHGLKKHDGNCQRIAHGHRSKIDIYINDQYSELWVEKWGQRWTDIYLASDEDLLDPALLSFSPKASTVPMHCSAYHSAQGYFELLMPASRCEVLNNDTTVEELARFICETIKQDEGQNNVTVYAYEGIGKGAIAEL